ncbi:MAG: hemin receptor [Cruoricaptor ignavus]|nr:hemin receptor [Cruoricaptor ignavus]
MIKKSLTILSVAAVAFVQAQDISVLKNSIEVYGNSTPSGTAKFNAMAGSMGALGGDISTMNTNPAGLGVAIASDVSATLNVHNNKNTSNLHGTSFGYSTNRTDLGQVGGVLAFELQKNSPWKFVNLGFNYTSRSIENYAETRNGNSNISFNLDNNETLHFDRQAYDRTGDVSKMNFGIGANYDNKVYVGAGLNFHQANVRQLDRAQFTFGSDNHSEFFDKQYTPYYEESSGFSASVGVIGKINNEIRLGASIETPTWWNIDRAYNFYGYDSNNDGEFIESRKLATPTKATLSAAYVPSKSFAINVDYTLRLSKPKFSDMDSGAKQEMDAFFSDNYKNLSEIRVGAEYRIQQFRVRGGYAYASSPFDQMSMNAFTNSGASANFGSDRFIVGQRNTLGVGLGYDFKSFYIDAAYNHISSTYDNPFLRGSESAGTEYYGSTAFLANNTAVVSEVKNTQNNITFTLGWKF